MRTVMLPALAAFALTLVGCDVDFDPGGGRFTRDIHYSYPLNAGGKLSIETFNGSIDVTGWDENTVEISGTKYGPTEEAVDRVTVSTDHTPAAISIRVQRPSGWRGSMGARFTVHAPRSVVLDYLATSNGSIHVIDGAGPARLRSSNGAIRVRGLNGSLEATTSNGSINAELTAVGGPVHAETSNGAIDLRLPPNLQDDVRAETSNGGITLHLPDGLNARISAHTSNSRVHSDFDFRQEGGDLRPNHMEGIMGKGGPLVELSTSNGGIHLLKL